MNELLKRLQSKASAFNAGAILEHEFLFAIQMELQEASAGEVALVLGELLVPSADKSGA